MSASTPGLGETTIRGMRWFVLLGFALVATLTSCSFVNEQVGISSASGCIRKECRDPDATDYARCEAACRQRYQQ